MRAGTIIWVIMLLLGLQAEAQVVTVKSSFGSDSVMLGEQITYTLTARSGEEVLIGLPEYTDTITSEIEIIEAGAVDTTYEAGQRILTREYLVASFAPGWNTVPPQPVTFDTGNLADTVYTTVQLLTVLAPQVDTMQAIMPIKPPVNTPVSLAEILPWALAGYGALLLITLVAALIWIRRQKAQDPEQFIAKPLDPAHVVAIRELEKLRKEALPKKGEIKEYYTRLTWIIRVYMSRQFNMHALESTSTEIIEAFSVRYAEMNGLMETLEQLLMLADLVKFAKESPSEEENERHLANAERFVEKTYRMFDETTEAEIADVKSDDGPADGTAESPGSTAEKAGSDQQDQSASMNAPDSAEDVEPKNKEERHG